MMNDTEEGQIDDILYSRFGTVADLERLVKNVGRDLPDFLPPTAAKIAAIHTILDNAKRSGWILKLLDALLGFLQEQDSPLLDPDIDTIQKIVTQVNQR